MLSDKKAVTAIADKLIEQADNTDKGEADLPIICARPGSI
jgi:hypothetical protein